MMRIWTVALTLLVSMTSAGAHDCDADLNPPRPSRMDDFGLPLGESRFNFPPEIKPIEDRQPCVVDKNAKPEASLDNTECEFIGLDGVRYTVKGGAVDKKELDATAEAGNKIPFFLKPQSSMADVARNMKEWVDGPTSLYVDADKNASYITGAGCLMNRLNIKFSIIFTFDNNDRLKSISTIWVPDGPI